MKKMVSLILAVIMLFSALPMTTYAEVLNTTEILIDSTYAFPGNTVSIDVKLKNNPGIVSATINVSFDDELTLVGATNGDTFPSSMSFIPPRQLSTVGEIKSSCNFTWQGADIANEDIKDGTILTLKFKVSQQAKIGNKYYINVTSRSSDIVDKNLQAVELKASTGTITVIDYKPGDVNDDGEITMMDTVMISRYIVDGCKYDPNGYAINLNERAANVNNDGIISMLDVVMISRYIVDGCKTDPNGYNIKLEYETEKCVHSMEAHEKVEATCEKDGNIAYWYCTACGKYFADENGSNVITLDNTVIKATGHEIVIDPAVEPTETTPGKSEGKHCEKCKKVFIVQVEIKPNTRAITYHIVNKAKHPYLASQQIDVSSLEHSYVVGETKTLKNLDLSQYGYTFDGWYDGFGDNATQIKKIQSTDNENIDLYAHVTEIEYDITYNMYQTPVSSVPTEAQLHYKVSKGNFNLFTPEINNYIFLGWYDDNGVEYKSIPVGTTGNITLNTYYTSKRNQCISVEDNNPIILEDQNKNVVYFTYEIGKIINIPLNGDKPFWTVDSVAGISQKHSETYTTSISTGQADTVSKVISDMTVNSNTWTLAESWNEITSVNEAWAESIGKTSETCKTDATTSSNTLSITNQNGGSDYHKTEDGTTVYDYNTKTTTKDSGHKFDASLSGSYANKLEANLGASNEYGATDSYGYTKNTKKTQTNESTSNSDKDILSAGVKYENGFEINAGLSYGYHNNTNTVTKTGTDKVDTNSKIDENTSTWNNSATFSATQQHSSSLSVRNTLSDIVTTTKEYGKSYSNGGTDSTTQGFSSTKSDTSGTTSSVTYSKIETKTVTEEYSVDGKIEGSYRSILVGDAHVFAVVGYDYATNSFFTYTFSVMDDETRTFLDYTPKNGQFNDCENSCLPFEVPYYVYEYVSGKTSKTSGVEYEPNSESGTAKIIGYTGTDKSVIIPAYISDGDQAYKVTEISPEAFQGKNICSVVLGEFIDSIPDRAFENCTALKEVIGNFTKIGSRAFAGCENLSNMNIPSNVVEIGTEAFLGAKSINARAINSLSAYAKATEELPNGTDEEIKVRQKQITQKYIQSVLDCGAENIVLDISIIADGTELSLEVPEISSVEIDGGKKTYNNFSIDSNATTETFINEMTITSNRGIPVKTNSNTLKLCKAFISGNNTALIMKKDGATLSLLQDSKIQSEAKYSAIGKNLIIKAEKNESGGTGLLRVSGDFGYVNSVTGESAIRFTDGQFKEMTEAEFESYIKGIYTVSFNANGGSVATESKSILFNSKFGELPIPTRDACTFLGWYKDDGTQVTEETVFTDLSDITLKAYWQSGWVESSNVPQDAEIISEKWTYTLREYTEQGRDSYEGWVKYDTKRTSWGATQGPLDYNPSNGQRNVWDESYISGYNTKHIWRFYKWGFSSTDYSYSYNPGGGRSYLVVDVDYWPSSTSQRPVSKEGSTFKWWTGNSWSSVWYESERDEPNYDSPIWSTRWYYQEPVYTYYYYRDLSKEATSDPTGTSNVSNVVKWVQYKVK